MSSLTTDNNAASNFIAIFLGLWWLWISNRVSKFLIYSSNFASVIWVLHLVLSNRFLFFSIRSSFFFSPSSIFSIWFSFFSNRSLKKRSSGFKVSSIFSLADIEHFLKFLHYFSNAYLIVCDLFNYFFLMRKQKERVFCFASFFTALFSALYRSSSSSLFALRPFHRFLLLSTSFSSSLLFGFQKHFLNHFVVIFIFLL